MKKIYTILICILALGIFNETIAQVPTCGPDVPYFQIDLTGDPNGTWESPSHSRFDNCCGTVFPDRCTSFEIIVDSSCAMVQFEIASGAEPMGSMFYQINCGPQIPVGDPVCISGIGPHYLTFCKPGDNQNTYMLTSIPKPIIPKDDSTRIGCILPLEIMGLDDITINSVYPGTPGQYNSYLSCTDCENPDFEPGLGSPAYIDYVVCGSPIASQCGYAFTCDTFRVYVFQPLNGSVNPNPAEFCSDGPGVLLTASGSGGDGNYSFHWLDSSTDTVGLGTTYTATSEENFTAVISDGLNSSTCPSKFITVPVTVGDPPIVVAGPDQDICANDPEVFLNGSVTNAMGGVWTGGDGIFDPNDSTLFASYIPTQAEIDAGSVTLTLTSYDTGGGCANESDQITINFSDTVDVSFDIPILPCYNSTGNLTANVSNGIPPYSILWSTGETSNTINVGAGAYWVVVTDDLGCSHIENVVVTSPPILNVTMSSTDVSVDGGSDGTATATVFGGTPPYSYLWNNGDTNPTATGLSYGIYTVTVTDDNGCQISESVVVNEPQCSGFSTSTTYSDVSCFGGNDGAAGAIPSGGNPPYSYSWNTNPVSTTASITGLTAGSYTVTVTDNNGCIDIATVSISEPTQLTNSMSVTHVSTIGGNDGSATANPNGGTPGYNYLWSPGGEMTQGIASQSAGVYYVDITDANSCMISDSVVINEPPCDNFNIGLNITNVQCSGDTDGSATVNIAHGQPPYNINWSDGQTGTTASGLAPGSYSVTVTDASNCTIFANFTITEPTALSLGLTATNVSCNSSQDGTIDLVVTGGTYPYSFEWSKGAVVISNSEDLVNLGPGTYSVEVTDANGCMASASIGIIQPTQIQATATKIDVSCYGDSDGSIDVTVTGGTAPYAYSWDGPGGFSATTEDISGLQAGLYTLSVTDANSCSLNADKEVFINQPALLTAQAVVQSEASCLGESDGSIDLTVNGGTMPYSYSWTGPSGFLSNAEDISGLIEGNYNVTVTDANGCTANNSINLTTVVDVTPPTISCINDIVVSNDPGDCGAIVTYTPPVGTDNCPMGTNTILTDGLPSGSFFPVGITVVEYTVTDSAGNSASCSFTVTVEDNEDAQISCQLDLIVSSDPGDCGADNVSVNLVAPTVTDNCGVATITNDAPATFPVGTTTVTWTVTDVHGNTATCQQDVTIEDNEAPVMTFCPSDTSSCISQVFYDVPTASDNCGVATIVQVSGLGSGAIFPVGTTTEVYEITDIHGNVTLCSFDVTIHSTPIPELTGTDVSCNGLGNGAIDLTVSSGTPPYTFGWSNGQMSEDISHLDPGVYQVVITDANGCQNTASITITEPDTIVVEESHVDVSCYGYSDGTIDISVNGGTPPYSYNWNNGEITQDIGNLSAGNYDLVITDDNGCTYDLSVVITQPDSLVIELSSPEYTGGFNVSGFLAEDGAIDMTIYGGTPDYDILWSNGSTNEDLSNLPAGVYSVTVIDQKGCPVQGTISLDQPYALEMPTGYSPNGDGENDFFVVHGLEAFPDNNIEVYNRWGNLVFSKDGYDNRWNGYNNNGDELPDATYFVILIVEGLDEPLTGYVDLRRTR